MDDSGAVTQAVFLLIPGLVTLVLISLLGYVQNRGTKLLREADLASEAYRQKVSTTEVYPLLDAFYDKWGPTMATLAKPPAPRESGSPDSIAEMAIARREVRHDIAADLDQLVASLMKVSGLRYDCRQAHAAWRTTRWISVAAVLSHLAWVIVYCLVPGTGIRWTYLAFVLATIIALAIAWPTAEQRTNRIEEVLGGE